MGKADTAEPSPATDFTLGTGVTPEQLAAAARVQKRHRAQRLGLSERVRARDAGKPVPPREEEREIEKRAGAHNPLFRVYDAVALLRLPKPKAPPRPPRPGKRARPRKAGPPGPRRVARRGGDSGDSDGLAGSDPDPPWPAGDAGGLTHVSTALEAWLSRLGDLEQHLDRVEQLVELHEATEIMRGERES